MKPVKKKMSRWLKENVTWRLGKRPRVELWGFTMSVKKGQHINVTNADLVMRMSKYPYPKTLLEESEDK